MNSMQNPANGRFQAFHAWVGEQLSQPHVDLLALPGDASFRYYYRISNKANLIAVDADSQLANNNDGFVQIAQALKALRLHVPKVYAYEAAQGFLIVEDLGQRLYADALSSESADSLYADALDSLAVMQTLKKIADYPLQAFDATWLRRELDFFQAWLLDKFLNIQLDAHSQQRLTRQFEQLIDSAITQPQVFIHRDYHSRNLLVCESNNPGIIDFQDAMMGPVTYDAVSLLRDAYIVWPEEKVNAWALSFYDRIAKRQYMQDFSREQFMKAFDSMGMQRHLKAAFIFARKFLRDDVASYLPDIHRCVDYVIAVSARYPEYQDLHTLMIEQVQPLLNEKVKR